MPWQEHPQNPLIRPRWWSWIVGDPCVLSPAETPDGTWRCFANQVTGIHQYASPDGVSWRHRGRVAWNGNRPWVVRDGGRWHLLYQAFGAGWRTSRIVHRASDDLDLFGPPVPVLAPDLPWEGAHVSNACLLPWRGAWWLYYSADLVHLADMGFSEPRCISVARGPSPAGPFQKHGSPVLAPEPGVPYRDRAAGAMKVYAGLLPDGWLAGFQNGIYRDDRGRSGSAVLLLRSRDGIHWQQHPGPPLLAPGPEAPRWRRAHVYQVDVKRVEDALWMWFNARDGWRIGVERVGLATLADPDELARGWDVPPAGAAAVF